MELYQLRSFAKVATLGNLTRAAEELHLTQPAVSSQIRALEAELGDQLFERKGRGLILSDPGKLLLDRAKELLALEQHTRDEFSALEGLERGMLRIGTNDSNCLYLLPDVIREFARDYPGIRIQLDNSHSSQVARWVADDVVELGIVTLPVAGRGLRHEELYPREDVLICPPDHPLAVNEEIRAADLAAYPLLVLHGGSVSHARFLGALEHASATPVSVMRVGSIEVIARYVEIGLGVSVVPRLNVARQLEESRLVERHLEWLPRSDVGLIRRKNGYLSPAARVFVQRLREHVRASFPHR